MPEVYYCYLVACLDDGSSELLLEGLMTFNEADALINKFYAHISHVEVYTHEDLYPSIDNA